VVIICDGASLSHLLAVFWLGVALNLDFWPPKGVGVSIPTLIGVGPAQFPGVGVSPNLPLPPARGVSP
jgi:hypothetical protein